jgi:osmotically-inducible protein OsmY
MVENGVNRLPVVDQDGKLVGIVARADLVDAFTQTDAEIEREIREDVMEHQLWMSSIDTTVEVKDGIVTLRGEVETELLLHTLPQLAAAVPGVVDVESHLTYRGDRAGV